MKIESSKIIQALNDGLAKIVISYKSDECSTLTIPDFSQNKELKISGFAVNNLNKNHPAGDFFILSVYLGSDKLDKSVIELEALKTISVKVKEQYIKDYNS